jgi:hypothetical protein
MLQMHSSHGFIDNDDEFARRRKSGGAAAD